VIVDGSNRVGAVAMSTPRRSYAVRDAGSPSRLGKVYKTYPYTLDALLQVLEEARLRNFNEGPQVITVVTGRSSQVIRRCEGGKGGMVAVPRGSRP
jgi:hypothetical protein